MKKCSCCHLEKDISEFKYNNFCKTCRALKKKLWRQNNPDKAKQYNGAKKKWLKNNKEKRKQYERQYYLKNKEKIKHSLTIQSKRTYKKNKRQNDPVFRLRENISNAINKALRKGKSSKAGFSIFKYLEYNIDLLKSHLQSLFDANMSWENYGEYWHIDHIIPQSDLPYISMLDNNFKLWKHTKICQMVPQELDIKLIM